MKPVFHFTPEYLERCKSLTTDQIVQFLEDYRKVYSGSAAATTESVSIGVPEHLLEVFRTRCELEGVKYQTQIKKLMRDWLLDM